MKLLHTLVLGLASATTAVASLCKPSAVPSSVSSSSSASPSPSTPATPPICVVNVIRNGYFGGGSLDFWTPVVSGGGTLTGSTSCGQYSSCAQLDTVAGGTAGLTQTVPDTGVGNAYTFEFNFRAVSPLATDAVLTCEFNGGDNGLSWTWPANDIPVVNWAYAEETFVAPTTSLTLLCSVTGTGANTVQLEYFNLNC